MKLKTKDKNRVDSRIFISAMAMLLLFVSVGCSGRSPSELKRYYSENYPELSSRRLQKRTVRPEAFHSRPGKAERMENQSSGQTYTDDKENGTPIVFPNEERADNTVMASADTIVGYLTETEDIRHVSDNAEMAEHNVETMIEDKLFKLVEDAYDRRDEAKFLKLYSFFLETFPQSSRKAYLDEKQKNFFYREEPAIVKLRDALVEVTYPAAKSLDELGTYFAKLRGNGIGTIQISIVQYLGTPVYQFAKTRSRQGYYFASSVGPLVDDLLNKITMMAHENGLRVLVSFPLRHHPLIGDNSIFIMDESWNSIQNRTKPNRKLDLFNPESKVYLETLIRELLASNIDGIVFKDDYTYKVTEGFSAVAQNRYSLETGRTISFNRMFVPVKSSRNNRFDMVIGNDFDDVALWRTREIKQLLWELTEMIRQTRKNFVLGIEVTPEMLLDRQIPLKWYSTSLHYLKDLDVDFFILKWRKNGSNVEVDPESYTHAATNLREAVSKRTQIYLKIPLSDATKNVILLNRRINEHVMLQDRMKGSKIAIGPVNRLDQLDFFN